MMRFALLIGFFLTIQMAYAAEQPTFARVTTYWLEEGEFAQPGTERASEMATAPSIRKKSLMAAGFS
jgi:hypothetical protein